MVEVVHAAFIVDANGTFSCWDCYANDNRSEIKFDPKKVTVEMKGKLK
jgi:hypothetical protein